MYEDIKKNKIKTVEIVFVFLVLISLMIYFVSYYFMESSWFAIIFAMVFSIISTLLTYWNSDKIVLKSVNARKAEDPEYDQIRNILDGLMIASGLTNRPEVYVMDSDQPNAFATGRDPEHAVICLTTGIIKKLDYYELESVIGHELSHIKNYDIRLSAVVSVMVGFVVMLSDIFRRSILRRGGRKSGGDTNAINILLIVLGVLSLLLAPIASKIIQLAVSRRREYLADATSVQMTRNPDAMISALVKISSDDSVMEQASNSSAHMFISNPFRGKKVSSIFQTQPDIQDRIAAIQKLRWLTFFEYRGIIPSCLFKMNFILWRN